MTTELDVGRVRQNGHYTTTETARMLGVSRSSLYRGYLRGLDYYYDERGRRTYTGNAILRWWNGGTDPETGGGLAINPDTGEATRLGAPRGRKASVKQTL